MWVMRAWNSITRHRRDAELAEEMEAHLALSIEAKVAAGFSPDDARRAAIIESGGIEMAREAYQDQLRLPVAERMARTFRHAARGLRRNPGFVLAVIISLGLGVGANTALFAVIEALLLRPLPFRAPEELVTIGSRGTDGTSWRLMNLDIDAWTEQSRTLVSLAHTRQARKSYQDRRDRNAWSQPPYLPTWTKCWAFARYSAAGSPATTRAPARKHTWC